jgi:phage FluMu protein Com
MLVRFLCPACHKLLGVAPRKVGAQVTCPKCGATILVPNPEEAVPTDILDSPPPTGSAAPDFAAAAFAATAFAATDVAATDVAAADVAAADFAVDIAASEEPPADAIGPDILGDAIGFERLAAGASALSAASKRRPGSATTSDKGQTIVISRQVLYFQAALLAVVAILALAAGYLIGSGARLHGP